MSDNIETLRVVGNNLTPHLIMEGKTKIKKTQAVITNLLLQWRYS